MFPSIHWNYTLVPERLFSPESESARLLLCRVVNVFGAQQVQILHPLKPETTVVVPASVCSRPSDEDVFFAYDVPPLP